jgi:Ca-activated chloride channel family protein
MKILKIFPFLALACALLFSQAGCAALGQRGQTITVLAGSELNDLTPMLDEIQQHTGVRLQFQFTGTLDGAEQIMAGTDADLAWFSHAKYLNLLPGSKEKVLAQEKIMLSPVVLGVKQSKAQAWGWVDRTDLTWKDVVDRASSGELHFAMTNPTSSNSGFSALVGVASALSGKGDALQEADIAAISPTLKDFFKGQALTAGSSGWLADQYVANQANLDGIINYESVLLGLNQGGKLQEPLVLVYPKEGIITADYPLMLLKEDKRAEYDKLVDYLRSADFQKEIMEKTLRRPVNNQVALSAAFPGQLLIELPFPSREEVVNALLFSYLNEQVKPSHTYYVLDTSGSMRGERMTDLMNAMDNLTGADQSLTGRFAMFRNREKVTILTFDTSVNGAADFEVDTNQPDSLNAIREHVHGFEADGGTAIFSALQSAYQLAEQARQQEPERIYSIVLMTDGENNNGISREEFEQYYQSNADLNGIRTFTILFGDANPDDLKAVAALTSGRMFDASQTALQTIFKEIRGYQ